MSNSTGKPPYAFTPEQYISDRVEQYRSWYDKKAVRTKSCYILMRTVSVIGGALVPVLANISSPLEISGIPIIKALVTIISLSVVIMVSLESVFHYREQWKNYRSTEQLLGHEKFLFCSRVGRYDQLSDQDAFRLFVRRVEEAISSENAATLSVMTMVSESADAVKGPRTE